MTDVQLENGYTKIANELLEEVAKRKFNGTQYRILFVVWRFTYGFKRKQHDLSLNFISQATGIEKARIKKDLNKLIESKVIKVIEEATFNRTRVIAFNKNYSEWLIDYCVPIRPQGSNPTTGTKDDHTTGVEMDHTTGVESDHQEIKNKNKYKEKYIDEIKKMRSNYSPEVIQLIDQYWNVIKRTRKTNKISYSIIFKTMEKWQKFDEAVIHYALKKHINSYDDEEHDEKYTLGIMRNTTIEQAEDYLNKKEPLKKKKLIQTGRPAHLPDIPETSEEDQKRIDEILKDLPY